jgi:outer membrane murein-binding lipoprotein Lpp
MENVNSNKERTLMKLLVFAWILAATLGGCVVSLNIQKNNSNSEQKVDQNASANQENDSTNFNFKMK